MVSNAMTASIPSMRIKHSLVYRVLWRGLWFYIGGNLILSVLLRDNLYLASVIGTGISVFLGTTFGVLALTRPSAVKFSLVPWIFLYFFWLAVAACFSPMVGEHSVLRVAALLVGRASIIFAIVIGFKVLGFPPALNLASKWFIGGILLAAFMFFVQGLESMPVTNRLGELEVINSKMVGQYISLAIPMLLFLPVYRRWVTVRYSFLVLSSGLLLATFSKASILATLVGVTMGWLFARRKSPIFFFFAIAAGLLGIVYDVFGQVQTYINSPIASSLTGRVPVWRFLFSLIKERPFLGYGFGVMKDVVPAQTLGWSYLITQAHNAFLDSLFSGGYIGLIVFSLITVKSVSLIIRSVRRLKMETPAPFFVSTLVILLLRSMVDSPLHLGPDFFILVLIALSAGSINSGDSYTKKQFVHFKTNHSPSKL